MRRMECRSHLDGQELDGGKTGEYTRKESGPRIPFYCRRRAGNNGVLPHRRLAKELDSQALGGIVACSLQLTNCIHQILMLRPLRVHLREAHPLVTRIKLSVNILQEDICDYVNDYT